MKTIHFFFLFGLACLISGCLSRGPALEVRYFEPTSVLPPESSQGQNMFVNLADVQARSYLDLPMVWRISRTELRLDEANRWVTAPSEFGDARLRAALFLAGPFASLESGFPRLSVSMEACEGVLGEEPRARVTIAATLTISNAQQFVFHHTEEFPLEDSGPEQLARGIGQALDQAAASLSGWLGGMLIDH